MTTWYVSTTGNDTTGNGSSGAPYATIQKASTVAVAGDTVSVASGSYTGGFTTTASGASGSPITYKSATKWGAKIVCAANNPAKTPAWTNGGSGSTGSVGAYVVIDGFEVDGSTFTTGTQYQFGIYCTGNNNTVQNCKVHDLTIADTGGGAAIEIDGWYGGANGAILANTVYNVVPSGAATYRLIHGIYMSCNGCACFNNLVIGQDITSWHGATSLKIANNTLIGGIGILIGSGDVTDANSGGAHYQTAGNNNCAVFNNIIYRCTQYAIEEEADTSTGGSIGGSNLYSNNLIYAPAYGAASMVSGSLVGTLSADPAFINATGDATGNYQTRPGAPPIDAGISSLGGTTAPTTDLLGVSRPLGRGYDLGAYEAAGYTSHIHAGIAGWAGGQSYAVGARVSNGSNAYQCAQAGTSGLSGGPSGTGSAIVDGSCRWNYISPVHYTTITDWLNGIPATRTQAYIGALWNDVQITTATNTPFAYIGSHAGGSSTNTITLTTAPGESIRDKPGPLVYDASRGVSFLAPNSAGGTNYFWIDDDWVVLDGLQMKDPLSTSACSLIGGAGSNITVRNCLIDGYSQGGGARIIGFDVSNIFTLLNSVVWDRCGVAGNPTILVPTVGSAAVNNTFIFTTYAATAACLDGGNNTTAQSLIARNNIFINYDQPVVAAAGDNQWAYDHNATTAASFPANGNGTDNGGSLYGLVAANEFVGSVTADVRLKWGARSADAAATDTTDLPSAVDIFWTQRPQGSAWDIGAFELVPPRNVGIARSRGRVQGAFATAESSRGTARARGTAAALIASLHLAARGRVSARGKTLPALLSLPLTPGHGAGLSRGKAAIAGSAALHGAGRAGGTGASAATRLALLSARTLGAAIGHPALTVTRLLSASGSAVSRGQIAAQALTKPFTGASRAVADGTAALRITLTAIVSRSTASGRAVSSSSAPLASRGSASASAKIGAPGLVFRALGRSVALGRSALNLSFSAARGLGTSYGLSFEGAVEALASTSLTGSVGALAAFTGSAALFGIGRARGSGSTNSVAALPIVARGQAKARGNQGTRIIYGGGLGRSAGSATSIVLRPLRGRGIGDSRGKTIPLNSTATLGRASSYGSAQIGGRASFVPSRGEAAGYGTSGISGAAFAKAFGAAVASGTIPASMTFFARGSGTSDALAGGVASLPVVGTGAAGSGGAGSLGAQTSLATTGTAESRGSARASIYATLAALGVSAASGASRFGRFGMMAVRTNAVSRGRASLTATVSIAAKGLGAARATAGLAVGFSSSGFAYARGRILGGPVALLAGVSAAAGRAAGTLLPLWPLAARSMAAVHGRLHDRADVAARSSSAARGRTAIGLILPAMSGHARSFGAGIVLPLTLIQGSSVAGSGGSLDVPSLTLSMRGVAAARGALFQRTFLVGSGGAMSSGKTIMSPWHFIVPDETGEPLSTLTELPTFSPALVTDQDYYVFDWGERAGVASDPIVAATVTATPNTISVGAPEIVGDQVRVLVGGTVVGTYALRCAVTLRSGRVLHWSVPVQIEKV